MTLFYYFYEMHFMSQDFIENAISFSLEEYRTGFWDNTVVHEKLAYREGGELTR